MLLRRLGRPFRVVPSAYRETFRRAETPARNAMRNALGKARAARLPRGASGIVIGADTFLYFRGRLIGKPRTMAEARRYVRELNGNSHWVYTGLCLLDTRTGHHRLSYDKTKVAFARLPDGRLDALLVRMRPLDKAGAYALQSSVRDLVAHLDGSRTNVIGLPLELLRRELRALN